MRALSLFLNHQILFCITICYIIGLSLSQIYCLSLSRIFATLIVISAIVLFLAVKKSNNLARIILCAGFCLFGLICLNPQLDKQTAENHIFTISSQNEDVVLIGILTDMVRKYKDHAKITVLSDQYRTKEDHHLRPANGKVLLRVQGDWNKDILPGDTVIIRAKLTHPRPALTEGGFDYKSYLAQKDILVTGYLRSQVLIEKLEINRSFAHRLHYFPERLRAKLSIKVDDAIAGKDGGLYQALLFGSKNRLETDTLKHFQEAGVMHVLAISGLHISIFGTIMYGLFYFVLSLSENIMLHCNIRKLAALLTAIPLIIYALLAGGNIPVMRALIMALIMIMAITTDKRKSLLALISLAALLILLVQPDSLYTASFQLSFAAVITILSGKRIIEPLLERKKGLSATLFNRTLGAIVISLLATIGTAPILLDQFNHLSLIGPIANLIVEPLICLWGLPFGLMALGVFPFSSKFAELLLDIGSIGLQASLGFTDWLSHLPLSLSIWLPAPPITLIFLYYTLLFFLLYNCYFSVKVKGILFFLGMVPLCSYYILSPPILQVDKSEITCFAVGQGSSTLIVTPKGKTILIDGGSSFKPGYNIGEGILRQYLFAKNIRQLDHVIITHPDSDHYNGLGFILHHFSPQHLWISSIHSTSESYNTLIQYAKNNNITVATPKPTSFLTFEDGSELANFTSHECSFEGDNDCGLILLYKHNNFSMLFPGDISAQREKELVRNENLKATILLASHHGSKSSSSKEFLKQIRPEEIIISSGRSKYFPAQSVTDRYMKLNIPFYLTRDSGSIVIISDGINHSIQSTLNIDSLKPL